MQWQDNVLSVYWNTSTPDAQHHISLEYLPPSLLPNQSAVVVNATKSVFTIDGVKSCDRFIVRILSQNRGGSSDIISVSGAIPQLLNFNTTMFSITRDSSTKVTLSATIAEVRIDQQWTLDNNAMLKSLSGIQFNTINC